jgi:hypothetical protein
MIDILKDISLVLMSFIGFVGMVAIAVCLFNKLLDYIISTKYGWDVFYKFVQEQRKEEIVIPKPGQIHF